MSHVTRRTVPVLCLLVALAATTATAQETPRPSWEFGFHGILLMNGFYNDASVNIAEEPSIAIAPLSVAPQRALGASIRQTRLVGTGDLAGFAGGALHAELDVDFFGAVNGTLRSSPALRVRRVFGEARWDRFSLLIGQEAPLVADVNPVSLSALGVPNYAGAGNLWLWIPQIRAGLDLNTGDGVRFGADVAALAATAPEGNLGIGLAPNTGESSGRPMLEGRLRAHWGDGGEIGLGGHVGWLSITSDSMVTTSAVVATAIVPLGNALELRGEWYTGKGTASLGGGAVGQATNSDGSPMESSGGWAQLNLKAGSHWELGAGFGYDDPDGASADEANTGFRDKNTQYSTRIQWRLAPAVVAFEYRHFATEYGGGVGTRTATHLNLAMGVEF